jgi:hypothetical protein
MKMNKRSGSKISLNRETLRNLSNRDLLGAAAGIGTLIDSCRYCDSSSPDCTMATKVSDCHCPSDPCTVGC